MVIDETTTAADVFESNMAAHYQTRNDEPPSHYGDWQTYGNPDLAPMERRWYVPNDTRGSDYSGGTHTASNYRVMLRMLEGCRCDKWTTVCGSHGTYAIALRADFTDVEILEAYCALQDYPVLDDMDLSELESEAEWLAWDEAWGYRQAFARALGDSTDGEIDLCLAHVRSAVDALFEDARERANAYWEHTEEGAYIDVECVAMEVTDEEINALVTLSGGGK